MKPLPPLEIIGRPDWNTCLKCGGKIADGESRVRVEVEGEIGVGHAECPTAK